MARTSEPNLCRGSARRDRRRGGSALEMALLLPWYMFLFVGAFDWGFYAHALISTENAARVAALYTSTSSSSAADSTTACTLALEEMKISVNLAGVSTCTALPLTVSATSVTGADGQPASQVTISYQTQSLIPIPGLLQPQFTFTRSAQMRVRS